MSNAIEIFERQKNGVINIIRAADVFAHYIIADLRQEEPDKEIIWRIVKEKALSGLNLLGFAYRQGEIDLLEKRGELKEIIHQVIIATYGIFEIYLIEKFAEYYRHYAKSDNSDLIDISLKKIKIRSLDEIKDNFYDFFKIHVPSFEIDYFSDNKSNFQPTTSWAAIKQIEKARNEIVHQGKTMQYKAATLMDAWYPFEFICRWVGLFNVNFDALVYEGRRYGLIQEYEERLKNTKLGKEQPCGK